MLISDYLISKAINIGSIQEGTHMMRTNLLVSFNLLTTPV